MRPSPLPLLAPLAPLALVAALAGCDPLANIFEQVETVRADRIYQAAGRTVAGAPAGDAIKVLTWNIKYGGGRIDFFNDRLQSSKKLIPQPHQPRPPAKGTPSIFITGMSYTPRRFSG